MVPFNLFLNTLNKQIILINEHPLTSKIVAEPENKGTLPLDNIVNGHIEVSQEYLTIAEALHSAINDNLIASTGQHSSHFYELRKHGYVTATVESDTFGPLCSSLTPPDKSWTVYYG